MIIIFKFIDLECFISIVSSWSHSVLLLYAKTDNVRFAMYTHTHKRTRMRIHAHTFTQLPVFLEKNENVKFDTKNKRRVNLALLHSISRTAK